MDKSPSIHHSLNTVPRTVSIGNWWNICKKGADFVCLVPFPLREREGKCVLTFFKCSPKHLADFVSVTSTSEL